MLYMFDANQARTSLPITANQIEQIPQTTCVQAEAMRALQAIQTLKDTKLAACLALVTCHKRADVVDREAVQELEVSKRIMIYMCNSLNVFVRLRARVRVYVRGATGGRESTEY